MATNAKAATQLGFVHAVEIGAANVIRRNSWRLPLP